MNDKDELMNAVLREISDQSDKVEDAANQLANLLWLHYCAYINIGFSEDRAFSLVTIFLHTIVEKIFGKK